MPMGDKDQLEARQVTDRLRRKNIFLMRFKPKQNHYCEPLAAAEGPTQTLAGLLLAQE